MFANIILIVSIWKTRCQQGSMAENHTLLVCSQDRVVFWVNSMHGAGGVSAIPISYNWLSMKLSVDSRRTLFFQRTTWTSLFLWLCQWDWHKRLEVWATVRHNQTVDCHTSWSSRRLWNHWACYHLSVSLMPMHTCLSYMERDSGEMCVHGQSHCRLVTMLPLC